MVTFVGELEEPTPTEPNWMEVVESSAAARAGEGRTAKRASEEITHRHTNIVLRISGRTLSLRAGPERGRVVWQRSEFSNDGQKVTQHPKQGLLVSGSDLGQTSN
jgi:hypothetical protein